jgi:hypothetical protein
MYSLLQKQGEEQVALEPSARLLRGLGGAPYGTSHALYVTEFLDIQSIEGGLRCCTLVEANQFNTCSSDGSDGSAKSVCYLLFTVYFALVSFWRLSDMYRRCFELRTRHGFLGCHGGHFFWNRSRSGLCMGQGLQGRNSAA